MARFIPSLAWVGIFSMIMALTTCSLFSQPVQYERTPAPKREFRAVWIATVLNIDYPRSPSIQPIALKEQYRNLLDQMDELGFNAVIVQVRPAGDALYPSAHAPWSKYLTGKQGQSPLDEFDPLAFMIEETHARSMEFHAWINPFRASMNMDTSELSLRHMIFRRPDWLVEYGGKMYFNPGIPQVRSHLVDVVGEIVDNYNVDGIHIDDYFYPYPEKGEPFPDEATYRFYGKDVPNIEDWRRSNTSLLVRDLHQRIKEARPTAQFGVSPFGVWRNKSQDPQRGSDTRAGATSYDDLYADVVEWINRGWVDYVMPQLYWNIGFEPADHELLLRWWSQYGNNTQLYIGHAAYKVANNKEIAWHQPSEIPRQVDLNRRNFQSQGSAFFSAKSIMSNPLRLKDTLRALYNSHALLPERPELELPTPRQPTMKRPRWRRESVQLRWQPHDVDVTAQRLPHYYTIYRFEGAKVGNLDDPKNVLAITPFQKGEVKNMYFDRTTEPEKVYTYVIRAVNRANVEGGVSNERIIFRKTQRIRKARKGDLDPKKRNTRRRR